MTAVVLGPAKVDLSGIRAGDRNLLSLTLQTNGTPLDLTGVTVTAQARSTADAVAVAVEGIVTIVDAPGGKVLLEWPGPAVAAAIVGTTFKGVWDLQLDGGAGDVTTVAAGTFAAELDVTR